MKMLTESAEIQAKLASFGTVDGDYIVTSTEQTKALMAYMKAQVKLLQVSTIDPYKKEFLIFLYLSIARELKQQEKVL